MKVSVILPYANPHVLDWVLKIEDVDLNVGCIHPIQNFRAGYFNEYDEINSIKYFFKNSENKQEFLIELAESDVLITLGIFDSILFKLAKRCKANIRLIVLSEPFNPINSKGRFFLRKSWSILIRKFYDNIDFLCIGGASVKEYYLKLGFKNSNYFNFGYFPDLGMSPLKLSRDNGKVVIGFLGQLIPRKGIDRVVNLASFLSKSNYNFEFIIAGSGELKSEVQSVVGKLNDNRVRYVGLISMKEEVRSFFEQIDILFVPSYFDGWGAVVSEGIVRNCIVVASDQVYAANAMLGDCPELVFKEDFLSIFEMLFKEGNIELFRTKMHEIANVWNSLNASIAISDLIRETNGNGNSSLLKKI